MTWGWKMTRAQRADAESEAQHDRTETVRYIQLMTAYLKKLAEDEEMEFLAYLLSMAESEARSIIQAPAQENPALRA